MINTHTLHYWLDYEPIDIDTLDKMIKTSSPFTPTVTYETEHPTNKMILVKKNIRLDEVPICLDKKRRLCVCACRRHDIQNTTGSYGTCEYNALW